MFENIAKSVFAAITGAVSYVLVYESKREHEIVADQEITGCEDLVINSSAVTETGKPVHGTLPASFVQDKNTGNTYVKKGAHSRANLVKELMYSNALHAIDPAQPPCLLMQTAGSDRVQFHTLSQKYDGTQDVEEFVDQGRTEELKDKKVAGLEAALIADHMLGKLSDTKLANMVAQTVDDELVFTTIDHERGINPSGFGFFQANRPSYPTTTAELVNSIHDLYEPSEENRAGLAGDPRAREFGDLAEAVMSRENMKTYYEKVATADLSPVIDQCNRLATGSANTVVRESDCHAFQDFFTVMQKNARETVAHFDDQQQSQMTS